MVFRKTIVTIIGTLCLAVVAYQPAEAFTCQSGCNLIRKACTKMGKATRDIARAACDDTREACRVACETDADPEVCRAGCDTARETCWQVAKAARNLAKAVCNGDRGTCRDLCNGGIDVQCVKSCIASDRVCRRQAKGALRACKVGCATGSSRRACFKLCKRSLATAVLACWNSSASCIRDCLPLAPPTTTLP